MIFASAISSNSNAIPNLYYIGAILFGFFAAAGWISKRLDKRINDIVPGSPTVKKLEIKIDALAVAVQEVKANGLPNGGSSMRDDIKATGVKISALAEEVAEHRGILDGIRGHFSVSE